MCHGKKLMPKLKQEILNNERKRISIIIYRCNSTQNSKVTESNTRMESDTDSNFRRISINCHVNYQNERELDFVTDLNVVKEQIETN